MTDIILAILLVGFVANGWKKGLVETLGQFIGIVAGLFLARLWAPWIATYVGWVLPTRWASVVAFLLIFVVVMRVVGWLVGLIATVAKALTIIPFMTLIFSALGAVAGLIEGIAIIGSLRFISILTGLEGWYVAYVGGSVIAGISERWVDWFVRLF